MKAKVNWLENAMFLGESGSGHTVVMDGPEMAGGRNIGIRPMEMLLLGVGGMCVLRCDQYFAEISSASNRLPGRSGCTAS